MAAMVSLAFNIGPSAFLKSTVLKAHNRGDFLAASRAFGLWNKATVNGVLTELAGLTARRAEEAAMYIDGNQPTSEKMPQAVAAESGISKSPIAQAGGVTAGLGVLGTVSQASDQVSTVDITVKTVKSFATDTLGIPANYFLPLVLIAAGAAVVYYRHRQRSQGWA
jgi:lysozyme